MKIYERLTKDDLENMLFYVATPYSKWPGTNGFKSPLHAAAYNINFAAGQMLSEGMKIFSPISQGHALTDTYPPLLKKARDHDFWMRADEALFDACDAVVVVCFRGWNDSRGVKHELSWAIDKCVPVIFVTPSLEVICGLWSGGAGHEYSFFIDRKINHASCNADADVDEVIADLIVVFKALVERADTWAKPQDRKLSEDYTTPPLTSTSLPPVVFKVEELYDSGIKCKETKPPSTTPNPKDIAGSVKPNLALNPFAASCEQALSQEFGALKYGKGNWRHQPISMMTYLAAAKRHIDLFIDGEKMDPDGKFAVTTGGKVFEKQTTNLGGAMASVAILIDAIHNGVAIDDRPKAGIQSKVYDNLGVAPKTFV